MQIFMKWTSLLLTFCFIACTGETVVNDHPAYQNPLVQPWNDSIAAHPENPYGYYYRAEMLSRVKEDSLALLDLKKAYELDSLNPDYATALGYVYLRLEQVENAIRAFQRKLKLKPGDARTRLLLSKAYLQAHHIEEAQQEVDKVLVAAPNYPDALYWQAQIKAAQKDTAAAISFTQQALQIDSGYYAAAYQLGDYYRDQGRPEAVQQYRYVFSLDTLNADPLFDIAYYYEKQGQWQRAKEAYYACLLRDRDYTEAYLQTGKILLQQDSAEKAI